MSERKKPGRKPRVIDIATYVCPRCNRVNGKQKNREMCPDCHTEYNRVRSREWHRKNKGRQQQAGRPKVGEWDRKESSKWLSVSLMPASPD